MGSPFLMHIVWIEGDLRQSCQLLYLFIILKNILDEDRPPAAYTPKKTFSFFVSRPTQRPENPISEIRKKNSFRNKKNTFFGG
jgi:hypothetical protein